MTWTIKRPYRSFLANRPRPRKPYRRSVRLAPELLEDRTLLSTSIPLSATSWTAIGPAPIVNGQTFGGLPVSGRITGVAADPTDPNTVFIAAAGGGVWKTTDGGGTWTPLTDNLTDSSGKPIPEFMGAIAETRGSSNNEVIYAGTGEANNAGDSFYGEGILVSTDGGATWTLENAGGAFTGRTVSKIAIDPTNSSTVYAAVSGFGANGTTGNTGIWKSTDGGKTWTNTTAAAPNNLSSFDEWSDVVIDPRTPSTLYAAEGSFFGATGNGVYKSTDGGSTWTLLNGTGTFNGTQDGRIALAVFDDGTTKELFVSIAIPTSLANGGQLYKMLKSTDGGSTFTDLTANVPNYMGAGGFGQGWYDTTLAVDPGNANYVYAGGSDNGTNPAAGNVESFDGGSTWQTIVADGLGNGPHGDDHAVTLDAGGNLIDGNDGGVFKLSNPTSKASQAWSSLNTNLQITQFTGVALDPTNGNIAYGGSQDNGTEKFNDALGWSLIAGGDGGFTRVDPFNASTVYQEFFGTSLRRSDDGGGSFTDITTGLSGTPKFYAPYVLDPSTSGRVLWGSDSLFESLNKGGSWTKIGAPGTNGFNPADFSIDAIAVAPSDPRTIYVTAGGHVFVTRNGTSGTATTWTQINIPGFSDTFNAIAVDPTNPLSAYIVRNAFSSGSGGHVFRTTNAGGSWTDITGNLPNVPVDSVVVDSIGTTARRTLYVGTDTGVYLSRDQGATWSQLEAGLANAQVVSLELNRSLAGGGILAAGTHGRGMWELIPELPTGGFTLTAAEGTDSGLQTLATFTDGAGAAALANVSADIDWGDGSSSAGTITFDATSGIFTVQGDHLYGEEGTYTVTVVIHDTGVPDATVTSTAQVSDPAVLATPAAAITRTENQSTVSQALATFTDPGGAETLANYTATIDWGDGTTSAGTITYSGSPGSTTGVFTVQGTHTYSRDGNFTITVTVHHGAAADVSTTTAVTFTDPAVLATGGAPVTGTESQGNVSQAVATFTDPGGAEDLGNYSATINWGDGTTGPGTITYSGSPGSTTGVFTVAGSHVYTDEGAFTITVTVHHGSAPDVTITTTATFTDPAVLVSGGLVFTGTRGVDSGPEAVATFTDPAGAEGVPHYSATIDWGDGSTSAGTITYSGSPGSTTGVFTVMGDHNYGSGGNRPISVTVHHESNPVVTVTGSAVVTELAVKPKGGAAVSAIEGLDIGGQALATFTDPAGAEGLAHYSATIDWGDGTTSAGAITYGGGPGSTTGVFTVTGSHAYAAGGNYAVNVTVHHTFAPDVTVTGGAAVTPVINLVTFLVGPLVKVGRHRYQQEVQIFNSSPFPISGHFALALDGLGLAYRHGRLHTTGVALLDASGLTLGPTPLGSPFVFAAFGPDALNSQQGGVILLEFAAPRPAAIRFTPRLLEGPRLF